MKDNTFIDELVKEIYEKIMQTNLQSNQKKFLLIGEVTKEQKEEWEKSYCIVCNAEQETQYDFILIASISPSMLGNLAFGCGGTEENFLLQALLEDKPVYILESAFEYERKKQTKAKLLYQQYNQYKQKILQYGIQQISSIQEVKIEEISVKKSFEISEIRAIGKGKEETKRELRQIETIRKKVWTEADFMKMKLKEFEFVEVPAFCIITPLAMDYVKRHSIQLVRSNKQ